MSLVTLDRVSIAYGHVPLLDGADLQIEHGERVCLIGRNGTGKSTLLQVVSGECPPDAGSIRRQPGLRIGRLAQDAALPPGKPVFDVVAEGLEDIGTLVAAYHHAAVAVAERGTDASLARLGQLQHELEERDGWRLEQRVELVLARLGLPADAPVETLSGGWRRRVMLGRALVSQPDLLLLDEPTNHLDIDTMAWLESFLADYPGAVLFVTHDRVFLQQVATRILELDRGQLTSWPGNYESFLRRKQEWLASEAVRNEKFDKRLANEETWLRRGVKARRTRDEGRVRALLGKDSRAFNRRALVGTAKLQVDMAYRSGQTVFEAVELTKTFAASPEASPVVANLTVRIVRGDRIALIGPNGSGKTTLLRLLLGEIPPDSGTVRQGTNVQIAYYDQQREQLDPERTVFDTIADGQDTVTVAGREQHVHGYLRDFLFPPERANSPVKALSGGERNRLLLARLFTRAANVLVLDEPTNDLDIETLEILEERLVDWPGTVLLVSHDRAFIEHVVTSTLVFEGGGRVQEYVGGYEDWKRAADSVEASAGAGDMRQPKDERKGSPQSSSPTSASGRKLSYREAQELQKLPDRIDALESELETIGATVADPNFYRESAEAIKETLARQESLQQSVEAAYERWGELDTRTTRR